jgi:hypothetical protein
MSVKVPPRSMAKRNFRDILGCLDMDSCMWILGYVDMLGCSGASDSLAPVPVPRDSKLVPVDW